MQITEPSPTNAGSLKITCDQCQHVYISHQVKPGDKHCCCPTCGGNTEQMKALNAAQPIG
jgi:Zn finger protein HypA/HybF involved in hydrogenase expression